MADGSSILELLVAGSMAQAAASAKGTKLTPVKGEQVSAPIQAGAIPDNVPGVFLAHEALVDVAQDLRRQAQLLLDVAGGLDVIIGAPEAVAQYTETQAETERKLIEREKDRRAADREKAAAGDGRAAARVEVETPLAQVVTEASLAEFSTRLQELAEEAQVATFSAPPVATTAATAAGWVCPVHRGPAVRPATSRKGRHYLVCAECDEFER